MADLAAIRDGLKTRLQTITGLRAFDTVPDQVAPPAAIIGVGPIDYDTTFSRGADRYTMLCRVYVGRSSERTAQDKLDGYLSGTGTNSIKAAIEGDPTLGGAVDTSRVTRASGYGVYEVAGVPYLGAEFEIDVIG